MLWGGSLGGLEIREDGGAVRIVGRFPYGIPTILHPGRSEKIEARAFAARVEAGEDIHFLAGHDFERPLASRQAGSLKVWDADDALTFEARIDPDLSRVGYVSDFLGAMRAGLVRGLSPGFRVPNGGDLVTREGETLTRVVRSADLFEISAVTRPAYPEAQIEARSWAMPANLLATKTYQGVTRWR